MLSLDMTSTSFSVITATFTDADMKFWDVTHDTSEYLLECVIVCMCVPSDPSHLLNDDVDDHHHGVDDADMKKMMSWFPPAPLQDGSLRPAEEESARAAPTEARCSRFHFISFYFFPHDGILSASLHSLHEMPAMETFLGAVTALDRVWIFCSI